MYGLCFDQTRLPRTMSRAEWREVDRWRRMTQKQIARAIEQQIKNIAAFGTTHPEVRSRMLDDIINPPLLVYPEPQAAAAP